MYLEFQQIDLKYVSILIPYSIVLLTIHKMFLFSLDNEFLIQCI